MSKINVFIKIDTTHKPCFYLDKSTTIADLKLKIYEKEGQEVDMLMFRTKPVRDKGQKGETLTLADYGCYNNCTFHASMRFLGGAQMPDEGCSATHFVTHIVKELGTEITTENCKGGGGASMEGCKESAVKKAKLKCGNCIFCADCMRMTIDTLLTGGTLSYHCGYSKCGKTNGAIDIELAYAIAAYSDQQKAAKDMTLDENALNSPFSMMRICSNEKCKRFIVRQNESQTRVRCGACATHTCWLCGKTHKNAATPANCGNDDCDPVANHQALINEGFLKNIYGKECWNKRLCPGPQCQRINAHENNCNHMTCPCGFQYCHWCLQNWHQHNSSSCVVKPKQEVTTELLNR